jgi:hypothetical protein
MKKNEDAAAKKKPKTSAAQIRVQKGENTVSRRAWSFTGMDVLINSRSFCEQT